MIGLPVVPRSGTGIKNVPEVYTPTGILQYEPTSLSAVVDALCAI